MRILYAPDANTSGASSDSTANEGATSTQDAPSVPSTEQQPAAQTGEATLDQVLAKGFDEAIVREGGTPTPAEGAEASDVQQLNKTAKQQAEAGEQTATVTEQEPSDQEKHEEKGPIPYERFQEVVQERNEIKKTIEQLEPMAESHKKVLEFCQNNDISNDDFVQAMEFTALMKRDPQAFWEKFKPVVEGLGVLSGDKLPEDLAKDVEDGVMPMERAKELAQLRAQRLHQGKVSELTQKQAVERQQQAFIQSVHQAWSEWDASKRKTTPDFKPGGNGLWELVNDRMTALATATGPNGQPVRPIRSPADAVKLAEEAYSFVMGTAKKIVPLAGARRALSSAGSSTRQTPSAEDAPTFEEAMQTKARELGVI
jgi:hypothetical protein